MLLPKGRVRRTPTNSAFVPALRNTFSAVTYNIHQWVGSDGVRDPHRTIQIIRALQADVIGLQEVSFASGMDVMLAEQALSRATGLRVFAGPTLFRKGAHYGNLLLTRFKAGEVRRVDLSIPGSEPRGAIDADLYIEGKLVRVIVTHLGLRVRERWYQVNLLAQELSRWRSDFVVLLGDFNCWFPTSIFLWRFITWFGGTGSAGATFPAHFPLFALDRILIRPRSSLLRMTVIQSPQSQQVSDHLPVKALIRC
ncbi:MAG TPA: endonuclease/exonuclease/phosphatase family protein [Thermodesulfobacteriota bacterium]|nr:endonuclease/exonuclease/phosphatase family protein [Deltaproteobacteria bacterium]HNR14823.1 endonuclease/exonuclease/phosphatase family protein [Thermodesulfobacteriota bacterium]HNU70769.1 endonuclease/exonuclease/phosphatase family protein [Thermodesulfobacteriota bacterium]HOC39280.1 endonuclease/exonuclease/phosphatase family protein [Thermodesulfobacteriota bacterium]